MTADDSTMGLFAAIAGREIPGGCETCDAVQTVQERSPGVFMLTVAHDDTCPVLRASRATAN